MLHPAQRAVNPGGGRTPGPAGSGAQASPAGEVRVGDRRLGRPDDVDGRIEGGEAVAAAMTRPQALTEAALGIVGGESMAAGARDQGIHRAPILPTVGRRVNNVSATGRLRLAKN